MGFDAKKERFAVDDADGEDCGQGAGEAKMSWAVAELRLSLATRKVGMRCGGFAGVAGSEADEKRLIAKRHT